MPEVENGMGMNESSLIQNSGYARDSSDYSGLFDSDKAAREAPGAPPALC